VYALKMVICLLMLVGIVDISEIAAAQNLRELARAQAREHSGMSLEQTAPPGDYWPKSIGELAREADVVLQAKLSRISSYLGANEDRILTDYSILGPRLIAGRLPNMATGTPGTVVGPLVLTVYGGEATVEGVLIRGVDNNREAIKDGGEYLLFLRQSRRREIGRYEIYYGGVFEILQSKVSPLLKQGDIVFKGIMGTPLPDVIAQVERAAQVR
jgi:hypothetical protein